MTVYMNNQLFSTAVDPQSEVRLLIGAIGSAIKQSYPERFNK
jgi:hypothetical protein